jgi:hypothetical protein
MCTRLYLYEHRISIKEDRTGACAGGQGWKYNVCSYTIFVVFTTDRFTLKIADNSYITDAFRNTVM